MKVYCSECRHHVYLADFFKDSHGCYAPKNAVRKEAPGNWMYRPETTTEWERKPEEINAHNDCSWFQAKAPSTKTPWYKIPFRMFDWGDPF